MAPATLFFEQPVLNSPYVYPARHWELDGQGQPTQKIVHKRRKAEFLTPIPRPKKNKGKGIELDLFASHEHTRGGQQYDPTPIINLLRETVDTWRELPNPGDCPTAAALAALQVQRHPAVFLPGGGGGSGHLADRGGTAIRQRRAVFS